MHDNVTYRATLFHVKQLVPAPSSPDTRPEDTRLVELWLSLKSSPHTRRAYASDIARFLDFTRKPLSVVTLADIQAWSQAAAARNLRPATRNRALSAVKSLLSFAQETGYLAFNVAVAMKLRPNPDGLAQRILDESEVARLIDRTQRLRDRALLSLLYTSGARVSELAQLKWCDLAPRGDAGQITVLGKGGKTRSILLKSRTWSLLNSLRRDDSTPAGPVFGSRQHGHLDPSQIRRIVYAASARAGLPRISPHWLRHAHASHALDRNAPIHLVQATLGHASVSTTSRYLHARPTDSSSLYLPD
jgi:site-specific recombinase XerD